MSMKLFAVSDADETHLRTAGSPRPHAQVELCYEADPGTLAMSFVHDLRSPLATIQTGAEILHGCRLPEQQLRRLTGSIRNASARIQELLQEYLSAGGYRVAHAWDGEQAMKLARELQPIAITLDILLPKKNGWEVLGELNTDLATKDIPVVIVSVTNDRQLGFSLGAIEYFVKPVRKDILLTAIRRAAKSTGHAVRTVLVVDDEPMTVEFLSTTVGAAA